MFDYPYENVRMGIAPDALRVIRRHPDGPTWRQTVLRTNGETDAAFCERVQSVAHYLFATGRRTDASVVVSCVYDMPGKSALTWLEEDNRENALACLWWMVESKAPRVPLKAAHRALQALRGAYGLDDTCGHLPLH
ncbi:hypothetical protein [Roseateles sp. BYS96W]|uniref:Uncharacterized protein n=1 Tax=Pelomonas nitida TaxID=3299027 RepID=A0ABW7G9V6_9BURK